MHWSDESFSQFFEIGRPFLFLFNVASSKLQVVKLCLLDGPARHGIVEHLKTDTIVIVHVFAEDSISSEFFDEASLHLQEVIKSTDVFVDMLLGEVVVISLNAEVFVYLGLLGSEETFNFLDASLVLKQFLVF